MTGSSSQVLSFWAYLQKLRIQIASRYVHPKSTKLHAFLGPNFAQLLHRIGWLPCQIMS